MPVQFRQLRLLSPFLVRFRWTYSLGALSVLTYSGASTVTPQIIGSALDNLMHGVTRQRLAVYLAALLGVNILKVSLQYVTRQKVIYASLMIQRDLRNHLMQHLLRLQQPYFQRTRTADVMIRLTNDLDPLYNLLGPSVLSVANVLISTLCVMAFMLVMSPRLTLTVLIPVTGAIVALRILGRKLGTRYSQVQIELSNLASCLQDNLAGVRIVRAYAQESEQAVLFETANSRYRQENFKMLLMKRMFWPFIGILGRSCTILVFWACSHAILRGKMTVAQWISFSMYAGQLSNYLISATEIATLFQLAAVSAGRINEILDEKPDENATQETIHWPSPAGEIEFCNLNFGYSGGPTILSGIHLKVPAGSSLAIVGPAGAGKTTLVNLIALIHDDAQGSLLVDGHPASHYPKAWLRRHIGYVPQETFLFNGTIRENITLGMDSATDEQVWHAVRVAHLEPDIEAFLEGLNTVVGERGIMLSGGQKQRIAIARAVIREPRIIILDDALSSVDLDTEDRILSNLSETLRGRTAVIVSHRASAASHADQVAVLVRGQIAEIGTPQELIAKNGYYAELVRKQFLTQDLAAEESAGLSCERPTVQEAAG